MKKWLALISILFTCSMQPVFAADAYIVKVDRGGDNFRCCTLTTVPAASSMIDAVRMDFEYSSGFMQITIRPVTKKIIYEEEKKSIEFDWKNMVQGIEDTARIFKTIKPRRSTTYPNRTR